MSLSFRLLLLFARASERPPWGTEVLYTVGYSGLQCLSTSTPSCIHLRWVNSKRGDSGSASVCSNSQNLFLSEMFTARVTLAFEIQVCTSNWWWANDVVPHVEKARWGEISSWYVRYGETEVWKLFCLMDILSWDCWYLIQLRALGVVKRSALVCVTGAIKHDWNKFFPGFSHLCQEIKLLSYWYYSPVSCWTSCGAVFKYLLLRKSRKKLCFCTFKGLRRLNRK